MREERRASGNLFTRCALASRLRTYGALECIRIYEYPFKRNVDCKEHITSNGILMYGSDRASLQSSHRKCASRHCRFVIRRSFQSTLSFHQRKPLERFPFVFRACTSVSRASLRVLEKNTGSCRRFYIQDRDFATYPDTFIDRAFHARITNVRFLFHAHRARR